MNQDFTGQYESVKMTDDGSIPYKELHEKYKALVAENRLLKEEVRTLHARLDGVEPLNQGYQSLVQKSEPENIIQHSPAESSSTNISSRLESVEKRTFFRQITLPGVRFSLQVLCWYHRM